MVDEGVEPQDIIILSPKKFSDCVASQLGCTTRRQGIIATHEVRSSAPSPPKTSIGFSTIHAFKGMESTTLVICDIDHIENDEPQALLYTGMSRARSYLAMLVNNKVRDSIGKALTRKLSQDWKQ